MKVFGHNAGKVVTILGMLIPGWILVPAAEADANLISNGDFEANIPPGGAAPSGWILNSAPIGTLFYVGAGPTFAAHSGTNSANFGSVGEYDDNLSQSFWTDAGQSYTVDFFLAHDSANTENDFHAIWNGTSIFDLVNANEFAFTEFRFNVVATGSYTTLAFYIREVPGWYNLDDVNVSANAPASAPATLAPEPGYALALGVGLTSLLGARRGYQCRWASDPFAVQGLRLSEVRFKRQRTQAGPARP